MHSLPADGSPNDSLDKLGLSAIEKMPKGDYSKSPPPEDQTPKPSVYKAVQAIYRQPFKVKDYKAVLLDKLAASKEKKKQTLQTRASIYQSLAQNTYETNANRVEAPKETMLKKYSPKRVLSSNARAA